MSRKIMMIVMGLMLIPGFCFAEFYKYRDANGVLRFTDNLADVPVEQRESVQEYQEVVVPQAEAEPVEKAPALDLNERADQLNQERDLLAQEYADLENEQADLQKATQEPQDTDAYKAYVERVEAFNSRIKAYEEKRKIFQEKVDAFNQDAKSP